MYPFMRLSRDELIEYDVRKSVCGLSFAVTPGAGWLAHLTLPSSHSDVLQRAQPPPPSPPSSLPYFYLPSTHPITSHRSLTHSHTNLFFPGVLALRRICADPQVKTLTLPLLSRFHGPSGYPSLLPFPGCRRPNQRQTIQAPGLLNCTALGAEVSACQRLGRRVLLSIKGDASETVSDALDFGDPAGNTTWSGYSPPGLLSNATTPPFPNLFDERHVPSSFALTMHSRFGEGREERADLRPLGPDTPAVDGASWVTRPLGDEAVVDGFDVQVPAEWQGTYQEGRFRDLVERLTELSQEAWAAGGAVKGGPGDLGAPGMGVVFFGWGGDRAKRMVRFQRVGDFDVEVRY